MFKPCGVFILCLLILISSFGGGLYTVIYTIAQQSLTDQYCVNKGVDDCCRAKCHVSVVVKNDTRKEDKQSQSAPEWRTFEYIPIELPLISVPFRYVSSEQFHYWKGNSQWKHDALWRPPAEEDGHLFV